MASRPLAVALPCAGNSNGFSRPDLISMFIFHALLVSAVVIAAAAPPLANAAGTAAAAAAAAVVVSGSVRLLPPRSTMASCRTPGLILAVVAATDPGEAVVVDIGIESTDCPLRPRPLASDVVVKSLAAVKVV